MYTFLLLARCWNSGDASEQKRIERIADGEATYRDGEYILDPI